MTSVRTLSLRRLAALAASLALLAGWAAGSTAAASTLCVGPGAGCYPTIQPAVDAAHAGDTIAIGPGTFAGGIEILKSMQLVGTAAGATTISGGGPVITIGDGTATPTVSMSRLAITGGSNDAKPASIFGLGFFAAGGGVLILEGATVTISDSVITGNLVTAGTPQPLCGQPCSFASGGGIANWGSLTVTNTRIADNVASGGPGTDARGGGIWNADVGAVTLSHSFVTGNRSTVRGPDGRFAEAGGIGDDGTLTIEDSVVSGNTADAQTAVPSTVPFDVQQEAVGGGIRITDAPEATATIKRSMINGNSVSSSNVAGDAQGTSGGIDVDGSLLLVDSRVDQNSIRASVPPESGNLAAAAFGGIEVSDVATIRNSSVSGNLLTAVSNSGGANVVGAGIANLSGRITMVRTLVTGNRGRADGIAGLPLPILGGGTLGGGILNIDFFAGPPQLMVTDSVITANALERSDGITPAGGGIFSADLFSGDPVPFTLMRTVVAGNKPDQCVGC